MSKVTKLIQAYLELLTQDRKFYGAILASKNGDILFSNGFGKANFELAVNNTPKTKFGIGSITKTITAVSILQLVQNGKLRLEDPISRYHSNQKDGDKITIHHLLTHTSGIPNYTDDPQMIEWSVYSFGMENSGLDSPSDILDMRAAGYHISEDNIQFNAPYFDPSNAYSAGVIFSTVEDFHIWDQALHIEQLLGQFLIDQMLSPFKGEHDIIIVLSNILQDVSEIGKNSGNHLHRNCSQ